LFVLSLTPIAALLTTPARRLLVWLALPAVCVAVVACVLLLWQGAAGGQQADADALLKLADKQAQLSESRLEAANDIATALLAEDIGPQGQLLAGLIDGSEVFSRAALLNAEAEVTTPWNRPLHLNRVQLATLAGGGGVLMALPDDASRATLALLRAAPGESRKRMVVFELKADFWWADAEALPAAIRVGVFDSRGLSVAGMALPTGLMSRLMTIAHLPAAPIWLDWQTADQAWDGALTLVAPAITAKPPLLQLVSSVPHRAWFHYIGAGLSTLPLIMLLALLLPLFAAWRLSQRYFLKPLMDEREKTSQSASLRLQTLQVQAQLDELLMGAPELEAVLEPALAQLRKLLHARVVAITLIDSDAPDHGRVFIASDTVGESPVRRVQLDPSMMVLLANSRDGVTIMRCEEQRHSFLMPLAEVGAQLFWAWPVMEGDRLAGLLTVGHAETPVLDIEVAQHGTACARRLGTVLSRGANAERLYRQANFDTLTQLPNRVLFRDRLQEAVTAALDNHVRGALLYVDLDHFKKVNDKLGHAAGDHLLSIVAQRLRGCVKEGDTVARLSGDEFTVVLRQVGEPAAALAISQRILESLQQSVSLSGTEHQVRASIGITLFPDDGQTVDELLRNADLAMYRAKDRGRATSWLYERELDAQHLLRHDTNMEQALKRREFSLFYQPQFSLTDGALIAIEALLRWESPRDGSQSPADFVPAAEESGLIVDLGSWVLESACAQRALWRLQGLPQPVLAVNVSLQQLRGAGYVSLVRKMLEKYALDPETLEFELVESVFADERAASSIAALRRLGVRLALAGFGSNLATINKLRRYPVRTVKLDRKFIESMAEDASLARLAAQVISAAQSMGRRVVAEGVENISQMEFLRECGCDLVQGYYLARPLNVAHISELLAVRRPAAESVGRVTAVSR
jgi:diguanylate cyclase (GGDEF)-like protein